MQNNSMGLKIGLNRKSLFKIFIFITIVTTLQACANMLAPTGGNKDNFSPKIVKSIPENYSKNFTGKKIEIEFDEYIVLKDIQNELIVSPGNIETEVKKSGKKIIVHFKKDLERNTTYILNFGNSISDYTESNINKELKFIFSTGNIIDSLNISGRIINAYKTNAVKDAVVCLYTDVSDDSVIYKSKPTYSTKTDKDGNFLFTNLKENNYKIISLVETNSNKIYDSQEEELSYIDTVIKLKKNLDLNILKSFIEIPNKVKIIDKKINYNKVDLILNKKYANVKFIKIDPLIDTIVLNKTNDTISLYYKQKIDSSEFILKYNDTKNDTLKFKFNKNLKKKNLIIEIKTKNDTDKIIINSNNKINLINKDSILLYEDSSSVNYTFEKKLNSIILNYDFNPNRKYHILIKDSAIVDYQGQKNKSIKNNIEFYKEEEFGIIELKFNGETKNKLIQLINEKDITIKEIDLNKINTIKINKLNPGNYNIRIIDDINRNGKWDTGDYIKRIQPEPVEYYKESIKIRANWELELEINL